MSLTPADVYNLASKALQRYAPLRRRVEWRQWHYNNDERVEPRLGEYDNKGDPALNNPFTNISDFQSDAPRRIGQQVIARLSENPAVFKAVTRRASSNSDSDRASIIMNAWLREIESRNNVKLQQAMGYGQVRDCYAVLHAYRLEHLRPPIPRLRYSDLQEIPEDERQGYMISLDGEGFEETTEQWVKRRAETYAGAGCPWNLEVLSPMFFARIPSKYGPGDDVAVLAYEVDAYLYDLELRNPEAAGLPSSISDLTPAPGIEMPRGASDDTFSTISSGEYPDRRKIWQIWTRTEFYELADYNEYTGRGRSKRLTASGGFRLTKAFKHDYGEVPFHVVWANRNYDPDPALEAEPYLEGVYRLKPTYDRMMKLSAAIMELTAEPRFYKQDDPNYKPRLSEDGDPLEEDSLSNHGGKLTPGQRLVPLQTQVSHGIPQVLQVYMALFKEAEPGTGSVEIAAGTAPWTARIWQTQANIGPRLLMEQQADGLRWFANFARNWHIRHPEEPFLAYTHPSQTRKEIVSVDPKTLSGLEFECTIAPLSSAEQMTAAQYIAEFIAQGLRKKRELHEAMGERDPSAYQRELDVELLLEPFRQQLLKTEVESRMATMFASGTDGKIRDGTGQEVDYREVLSRNGYVVPSLEEDKARQQAQAQAAAESPSFPITRSAADGSAAPLGQRQLPNLAAPGTPTQQGLMP